MPGKPAQILKREEEFVRVPQAISFLAEGQVVEKKDLVGLLPSNWGVVVCLVGGNGSVEILSNPSVVCHDLICRLIGERMMGREKVEVLFGPDSECNRRTCPHAYDCGGEWR